MSELPPDTTEKILNICWLLLMVTESPKHYAFFLFLYCYHSVDRGINLSIFKKKILIWFVGSTMDYIWVRFSFGVTYTLINL